MRHKQLILVASGTLLSFVGLSALLQSFPKPLSLFTSNNETLEVEHAFVSFIAKYQKQYASKDHLLTQFEVFKENFRIVKAHKHPSYELGIN